jgi:hypothetical protein
MRVTRVPDVKAPAVEVFHCGAADGAADPGCAPA